MLVFSILQNKPGCKILAVISNLRRLYFCTILLVSNLFPIYKLMATI